MRVVFLMLVFLELSSAILPAQTGPHSGLLNHQVGAATGNTLRELKPVPGVLLAPASVPDAVATPRGDYLYYVNGEPGKHGIYVANVTTSACTVLGPVLIDGAFNGNAVDPDVVRLADGRIRLFYFEGWFVNRPPPPGTGREGSRHPIFSAVSSDGIHFLREGKVFEHPGVADPSVVALPDGTWLMACSAGRAGMVLARSRDGRAFQMEATSFEPGIPELTVADDGSVQLVYNVRGGLGAYRSTDGGKTWTKEPGLFFAYSQPIADPSLTRDSGGWRLYFKGFRNPPQPRQQSPKEREGRPRLPGW